MDVYEIVTERVIAAIEKGTVPWQVPWKNREFGIPRNFVSTKPYRGINPFMLSVTAMMEGYNSPFWVSYKQAAELGGNVKHGEKSKAFVVFFKVNHRKDKQSGEVVINEKTGEVEQYAMLRYTAMFNTDQCEGLNVPSFAGEKFDNTPIEAAEKIVDGYKDKPEIRVLQSNKAFYSPSNDSVTVPELSQYEQPEQFYSTLFHELGHSTGAKHRLDRDFDKSVHFADHEYSKEELVAEFTASFLCATAGIETRTIDNSSAYIDGWTKKLQDKENKKWLVWAASQASKAADYIQGKLVSRD